MYIHTYLCKKNFKSICLDNKFQLTKEQNCTNTNVVKYKTQSEQNHKTWSSWYAKIEVTFEKIVYHKAMFDCCHRGHQENNMIGSSYQLQHYDSFFSWAMGTQVVVPTCWLHMQGHLCDYDHLLEDSNTLHLVWWTSNNTQLFHIFFLLQPILYNYHVIKKMIDTRTEFLHQLFLSVC